MKGSLSQRCPAEILSEIQRRQISGTASFTHAGISRQLFFDAGVAIRFAASNHPAESFTAHLATEARLGNMQMRAATEAKQPEELLGTTLVRLGILQVADLRALTHDHIQRVVQAALAMSEGEWEFQGGALPFREQLDAGLRTAEVVLEWSRSLRDVDWIRRHLGPDGARIQRDRRPPEGYQSIRLDAAEGYIMSRVDGAATLREIGMVSPMGDERTLAALLGLTLAGILEMPLVEGPPLVIDVEPAAPEPPGRGFDRSDDSPPPIPAPPAALEADSAAAGADSALSSAAASAGATTPGGATATAPPLRLVPPPGGTATPARPAAGSPPGTTQRPRPSGTMARAGHGGMRRPGDKRTIASPRRPAPAATAKPAAPAPAPLPEGRELEAEMSQRFDQMDTQDLYQVLGVSPSAPADDIRRAYYGLARRFHPDRVRNDQVKPRAEKVFGRITEAYATLSDPDVRQRYDLEEAGRAPNRGDSHTADTTDLARQNFRTGREHLERGHLAEALGFLVNACRQDPTRPEYFELLGVTQSKNPRFRKDAEENLLKAIALDPASASAHAHLGALYDRTGAADKAREMYRKALEWDPDNAIARQGLETPEPARKGILGLFSRRS